MRGDKAMYIITHQWRLNVSQANVSGWTHNWPAQIVQPFFAVSFRYQTQLISYEREPAGTGDHPNMECLQTLPPNGFSEKWEVSYNVFTFQI